MLAALAPRPTSARGCQAIAGSRSRGLEQREAQVAVGEHPAERAFVRLGREVDPPGLHPVGDRDRARSGSRAARAARPGRCCRTGSSSRSRSPRRGRRSPRRSARPGSARSTTWLVIPVFAAASASVMPTSPPPRITRSRLSLIGCSGHAHAVFASPPSRSRQRPSHLARLDRQADSAASVGAMSTVPTGWGCSYRACPCARTAIGTRRS